MNRIATPARPEQVGGRIHVRWKVERDMPEILEIEELCFQWDAWTEAQFLRLARRVEYVCMVAEHGDKVVGFMVYRVLRTRLHLLNFAVHPDWHRRGVGSQMAWKLAGKLREDGRRLVTLDVRETNLAAQLFFSSVGFRATGVARGFYDNDEDAIRMEYRIR